MILPKPLKFLRRSFGFTLIELMIVVAIIGVLAAVAIPSYIGYIRRSHVSEATTSISAIKSAEESYFSTNNCYIGLEKHPATTPSATVTPWDTPAPPTGWGTNALGVRPDRNVRFSYTVYASNGVSATGGCAAAGAGVSGASRAGLGSPPNAADIPCITGTLVGATASTPYVNTDVTPQWYIVVAQGNQDGDATVDSMFVSAIDDSAIISCNETR